MISDVRLPSGGRQRGGEGRLWQDWARSASGWRKSSGAELTLGNLPSPRDQLVLQGAWKLCVGRMSLVGVCAQETHWKFRL